MGSMRAKGGMTVRVEGITERDEIGELAKLATFLGCNVFIESGRYAEDDTKRAKVFHDEDGTDDRWLVDLAAGVVCLEAVVRDRSVDQLLEDVRQKIERWRFGPLDRRPSDNRPFGAGDPSGEE